MANRHLVTGGTGNWNSTTNWSDTAGGLSGFSFPTVLDDVFFDTGLVPITVNVASACKTLTMATGGAGVGYTGALTMTNTLSVSGTSGSNAVTLGSNFTMSGTGSLSFNGTGGQITSNGAVWNSTFLLQATTMTIQLMDNWKVKHLQVASSSTETMNGFQMEITGDLKTTVISSTTTGTTNLLLSGTGTWSNSANTAGFQMNITIASVQTTISGQVNWGGAKTLTYTSGSMIYSSAILAISNLTGAHLAISGMTIPRLALPTGSVTITLDQDVNVSGDVTANSSTTQIVTLNGAFNLNVGGNLSMLTTTSGGLAGTATIVMTGTGTISQPAITSGSILNNLTVNTSGTITFTGNASNSNLFNYSQRNLFLQSGAVNFASANLQLLVSGVTITNNIIGVALGSITTVVNAVFAGTKGFSMTTLSSSSVSGTLTIQSGNTYTVSSSISLRGTKAGPFILSASTPTSAAFLNLTVPISQEIVYVNATDIDSSGGGTVWDFGAANTLTRTVNWRSFTQPTTVAYGFSS